MFHIKNYDCMNTRHIRGALHGLLNIVTLRDKKQKKKQNLCIANWTN